MDIYSILVFATRNPYWRYDDALRFHFWDGDGGYLGMRRLRLLEVAWKVATGGASLGVAIDWGYRHSLVSPPDGSGSRAEYLS